MSYREIDQRSCPVALRGSIKAAMGYEIGGGTIEMEQKI
jgi:hypothetical protein